MQCIGTAHFDAKDNLYTFQTLDASKSDSLYTNMCGPSLSPPLTYRAGWQCLPCPLPLAHFILHSDIVKDAEVAPCNIHYRLHSVERKRTLYQLIQESMYSSLCTSSPSLSHFTLLFTLPLHPPPHPPTSHHLPTLPSHMSPPQIQWFLV